MRSPRAPSMRRTGGQYLFLRETPAGYTASSRSYGLVPLADQRLGGVRRPAQRRLLRASSVPVRHLVDLRADGDHRGDEPVDLAQVLGLGRLDHQRARDRERHGRRVEAVVDEPLRDVVDRHAGLLGDLAQVEDALVRDQAVLAGVEHRVVRRQPRGDVVRRQHGDLRGRGQAGRAHHPDVGPGDRQDRRRAVRRAADRADAGLGTRRPRAAGGSAGNGARCARTATGPTPGPPPPCGMQNVLCRFRCETSPPNSPGLARPSRALRFAPSTYTWPPPSWTILASSSMSCSYTPCVDG